MPNGLFNEIVICGDLVTHRKTEIVKEAPLADYIERLLAAAGKVPSLTLSLLPENCIACAASMAGNVLRRHYVIQEPPQIRTLKYRPARRGSDETAGDFAVALPWLQWYITIAGRAVAVSASSSPAPVSKINDSVARAPIPNVFGAPNGMALCLGELTWPHLLGSDRDACREFLDSIWTTNWNDDLATPWAPMGLAGPDPTVTVTAPEAIEVAEDAFFAAAVGMDIAALRSAADALPSPSTAELVGLPFWHLLTAAKGLDATGALTFQCGSRTFGTMFESCLEDNNG